MKKKKPTRRKRDVAVIKDTIPPAVEFEGFRDAPVPEVKPSRGKTLKRGDIDPDTGMVWDCERDGFGWWSSQLGSRSNRKSKPDNPEQYNIEDPFSTVTEFDDPYKL